MTPVENPFYYHCPVRPSDFIGRWSLVDDIVGDLLASPPRSCAVIGGKRFGKSSTLRAIESRLLARCQYRERGERYAWPCVVDLKRSKTESEETVYASILRYLYRELRRYQKLPIGLPNTRLHTFIDEKSSVVEFWDFEEILDNLCDLFEKQVGLFRLIFLLDEGEFITDFQWAETLFSNLRALIHDGPLADIVQLVLTGSTRVVQVREEGSPLLNTMKIYHLQALSRDDIQALIQRAGVAPEAIGRQVNTFSGGHPFIAQYLLHHLWFRGFDQVKNEQVENIAVQLRQERALDFEGWWQAIGDGGKLAYAFMAQCDNWPECEWLHENSLLQELSGSSQPLDQGLAALCYHGLAVRDESRQRYRAVSLTFRDWLVHNAYLSDAGQLQETHALIIRLHWLITKYFNLDELETMCFALHMNYEDLGGVGLSGKARELILSFQRQRGTFTDLAEYIRLHRPFVNL